MKTKRSLLFWFLFVPFLSSCGKKFLEVKSDAGIGSPSTIADFQAILDYGGSMNSGSSHRLSIIGADELNLTEEVWQGLTSVMQRNAYIWADEVYDDEEVDDWNRAYTRIMQANLVLDGLREIDPSSAGLDAWDNAKGSALFFRAMNFYQIAQLFCKPFHAQNTSNEAGIPIRLEADVTLKSTRETVQQTYNQMLGDLHIAVSLLPATPLIKMRPSRVAAHALMARVFLAMEDYEQALLHADTVLSIYDRLYDFNKLEITPGYSFPRDDGESNPEVLFYQYMAAPAILAQSRINVDSGLLNLYDKDDQRRQVFFDTRANGNTVFRGSLSGSSSFFTGLTTAEMTLIRAECYARLGDAAGALADLNRLLVHRYAPRSFVPFEDLDEQKVLFLILNERRKELAFRGVRWSDLRRLNKDPRFAKTIVRQFNPDKYKLVPHDLKYVWPIPRDVIALSGIEQNPR